MERFAAVTQQAAPAFPPLCRALRLASIETKLSQAEIARRLGEKQNRISRYYNDREPNSAMTIAMERAYGLPPGWLWVHAGYLPAYWNSSFERELALDDELGEDGKQMLIQMREQLKRSHRERNGGLLTTAPSASQASSRRATS